ncbi:hypothetical protein [Angustibacter luteus]|uniref:Transmembrane protein n=1 Tax=Angustibacter luteus TaxID=658456 RepID=A0ABW1JFT5_9ACTN
MDTWAWDAPKWILRLLVVLTLVGWVVLAVVFGSVSVFGSASPRIGWKLVVTSGASVALALAVVAVAVQSFVGNDRGLSGAQLASLAKLAGANASDRGTDAVKTVYSWREDQWRQLARGAAGVVVALLVAIVPLLLKAPTVENVYSVPPAAGQLAGGVAVLNGLPLTQTTVSSGSTAFPPALWVALADLLLLAVLAMMFARGAHRSYIRDIATLAEKDT